MSVLQTLMIVILFLVNTMGHAQMLSICIRASVRWDLLGRIVNQARYDLKPLNIFNYSD